MRHVSWRKELTQNRLSCAKVIADGLRELSDSRWHSLEGLGGGGGDNATKTEMHGEFAGLAVMCTPARPKNAAVSEFHRPHAEDNRQTICTCTQTVDSRTHVCTYLRVVDGLSRKQPVRPLRLWAIQQPGQRVAALRAPTCQKMRGIESVRDCAPSACRRMRPCTCVRACMGREPATRKGAHAACTCPRTQCAE